MCVRVCVQRERKVVVGAERGGGGAEGKKELGAKGPACFYSEYESRILSTDLLRRIVRGDYSDTEVRDAAVVLHTIIIIQTPQNTDFSVVTIDCRFVCTTII